MPSILRHGLFLRSMPLRRLSVICRCTMQAGAHRWACTHTSCALHGFGYISSLWIHVHVHAAQRLLSGLRKERAGWLWLSRLVNLLPYLLRIVGSFKRLLRTMFEKVLPENADSGFKARGTRREESRDSPDLRRVILLLFILLMFIVCFCL